VAGKSAKWFGIREFNKFGTPIMRLDIYFTVRVSDLDCYFVFFCHVCKGKRNSRTGLFSCTQLKNAAQTLLQGTKKQMKIWPKTLAPLQKLYATCILAYDFVSSGVWALAYTNFWCHEHLWSPIELQLLWGLPKRIF
jgi:hypothetical protein